MASERGSEGPGMMAASGNGRSDKDELPWEYSLRKYLLLLATLVATVTYTAGFSPPGGVWQETEPGGHLAGDPILRQTSYHRYVLFFYLNAAAFASSLVVIVLILILSVRHELTTSSNTKKWLGPLGVLRGFMVLDLLSLMGAYTAGIYRDRDVPVYPMVLAVLTVVYLVVMPCRRHARRKHREELEDDDDDDEPVLHRKKREKLSKVLMLLATFAISVTYSAGLNAPGGFWDHAEDGHQPGEPILMGGRHELQLKAFVHFNSTTFFFSLLITVQLLDKKLRIAGDDKVLFRFALLYVSIVFSLLGLVGAYAAGSSRATDTTIYVILVGGAVPASIVLLRVIIHYHRKGKGDSTTSHGQENQETDDDGSDDNNEEEDKARSLVLLLATLAATITYQAGLDPPGGLWANDGIDYMAGDPILRTTNHKRYNAFFFCNSIAFVASLVAIILVKKSLPLRTHALQAAMILDLFGLIGAYAAGSCRDVSTSIYSMALAGAVLVYVVIHVLFLTLDHDISRNSDEEKEKKALEVVEKRRKRLLLFAILGATITYQAGLTPPGGFRLQDDEFGQHAGNPILLYNFPRRYNAFFYCNSVSFMLSISMILLLVNKNLYKPAIQSHAISVCTAAGMLSLVGAYAAGSTQHMRTSIKIFGLVAAILIVLVAVVLIFVVRSKGSDADAEKLTIADIITNTREERKRHAERKYLMLLGILVASITYQAGLKPPGGMWQDNYHGHTAGNPIMHDNGRTRYLTFFYVNSASFVASVIVIILLLMKPLHIVRKLWLRDVMNTTIMLDLLGLLVAYAFGTSRLLKMTGYVFMLVFMVLAYIAIHVSLSHVIRNGFRREEKVATVPES